MPTVLAKGSDRVLQALPPRAFISLVSELTVTGPFAHIPVTLECVHGSGWAFLTKTSGDRDRYQALLTVAQRHLNEFNAAAHKWTSDVGVHLTQSWVQTCHVVPVVTKT